MGIDGLQVDLSTLTKTHRKDVYSSSSEHRYKHSVVFGFIHSVTNHHRLNPVKILENPTHFGPKFYSIVFCAFKQRFTGCVSVEFRFGRHFSPENSVSLDNY